MKIFQSNSVLPAALSVSLVVHAVLLVGIRIVAPDIFKGRPIDPDMQVIIVNAKHSKAPKNAEALAQVNLDGGGNADAGHAQSPLVDMHKNEDGEDIRVTKRRIEELEIAQQKMLVQAGKSEFNVVDTVSPNKDKVLALQDGNDKTDNDKAIQRQAAEIYKSINDYNKRPRLTLITPSTRQVGYARYYAVLCDRIEKMGTLHFPHTESGKKLYGELLVFIPIYQDGSIYKADGGPRIEHTSGSKALDKAALRIVAMSAPFASFPREMRSADKTDVWAVVMRFTFSREEVLETELRGASN